MVVLCSSFFLCLSLLFLSHPLFLSYLSFVSSPLSLSQQLLGLPVSLDDMESVDPELYRSLKWML